MESHHHKMTQLPEGRGHSSRDLWARAVHINLPLTITGGLMLVVFLVTLIGIFVDHRVITGAPDWAKPAKFAISISLYCFTLVWLLGFVESHPRLTRLAAKVTVLSVIVEMIAIVTQAARGTTSHFNMSTAFNSFLWVTMGAFIVLVWAMNLLLAILLVAQPVPGRSFAWSLRLGVLISSVGMAAAFLMTRPTPQQLAAINNGGPRLMGAHSVGVPDGGPGLPFVGWSTVGGDLRVAHFVGLHGLQILPLLGWLLTRRKGVLAVLRESNRLALVGTAGVGYLGLVLLLLWQALRGQSVVHPDRVTVAAMGALAAGVATSILINFARAFQSNRRARELASAIQILSSEDV
jgi:hypothetical protein